MLLPFTKMHGLGNDFVVVDLISHRAQFSRERIRQLADRHFGIGFDQLLLVLPPGRPDVDFDYRIYNADGGEVEHCGNGARCFAVYVREKGLCRHNPVRVATVNRILELDIADDAAVTVNMGAPGFIAGDIPWQGKGGGILEYRELPLPDTWHTTGFLALSMGNPHAVIQVQDVDTAPVELVGRTLGSHGDFPQGVNVGFMQIVDRHHIRLRVFERGAGETLACGTGACAAVVAGCVLGLLGDTVRVTLRGGDLTVKWSGAGSPVLMSGPATTVFEGTIQL